MPLSDQYLIDVSLKRDLVPSFAAYPFHLDAVRSLSSLRLHPKVTFLIGENGSGKSTLLEAIAVAWGFNPEGGTRNFAFGTYKSHSELHTFLRLSRGVPAGRRTDSSCAPKVFLTWPQRSSVSTKPRHSGRR